MNETLTYIESYFDNSLAGEERIQFEQRINSDATFAGEVAFYLQARQVLRQELLQQKNESWKQTEQAVANKTEAPVVKMKPPSFVRRAIAIAAGVVLTAGISIALILNSSNDLQRLADEMIKEDMAQIGGEMGNTENNTNIRAIEAFNTADYTIASKIFDSLQAVQPNNLEALEYSGNTALLLENYDTAISRFHKLATHTELHSNPGKMYEALAIIKSKRDGYKDQARALLNEVVNKKLEGWMKANELLQKLK